MEQNHIVHRDIAASNVLLTDNDTAKISDFGLAKKLEPVTKENGNYIVREKIKCRTKWTAPEALELRVMIFFLLPNQRRKFLIDLIRYIHIKVMCGLMVFFFGKYFLMEDVPIHVL